MASQACAPQVQLHRMHSLLQSSDPTYPETLRPPPYFHKIRIAQATALASHKLTKLYTQQKKAYRQCGSRRLVSVSASAASAAPTLFDPAYRAQLADEYGFTQVGEPLPPEVTMQQLRATIPPAAFKMVEWKAWRSLAISTVAYVLGLCLTALAPSYLAPLGWAWTGTALFGYFVIAHECGHRVFCSNKLVEDIVGHFVMAPLLYPFEAWRIKHDQHHAKCNMLHGDTAWHPVVREEFAQFSPIMRKLHILFLGPLRFWATTYHWFDRHFDLNKFRPNEQNRVKMSLAVVFAIVTIGWPLLIYLTGIKGWVNFYLMPWLVYHFWMSNVTMIQHTAPHISFQPAESWDNTQAQLVGTVHCEFPKLLSWLFHDLMVHVPHHISTKIPSYNLRLANDALRKHWGKHFNEARWNWRLVKTHCTKCHFYDEEKGYVPFDDGKKEFFVIGLVRKLMPNTA